MYSNKRLHKYLNVCLSLVHVIMDKDTGSDLRSLITVTFSTGNCRCMLRNPYRAVEPVPLIRLRVALQQEQESGQMGKALLGHCTPLPQHFMQCGAQQTSYICHWETSWHQYLCFCVRTQKGFVQTKISNIFDLSFIVHFWTISDWRQHRFLVYLLHLLAYGAFILLCAPVT